MDSIVDIYSYINNIKTTISTSQHHTNKVITPYYTNITPQHHQTATPSNHDTITSPHHQTTPSHHNTFPPPQAVLENKWPSSNSTSYQKWMKLRNVILAVGRFKRYKKVVSCAVNQNCNVKGCGRRSMDVGVLGVNKGDDEMVASSSKPVDDNNTAKNNRRSNATTTTLSAKNKARSSTEVASTDVPINRPSLSTGWWWCWVLFQENIWLYLHEYS